MRGDDEEAAMMVICVLFLMVGFWLISVATPLGYILADYGCVSVALGVLIGAAVMFCRAGSGMEDAADWLASGIRPKPWKPGDSKPYVSPKVVSATFDGKQARFEVRASHWDHVVREVAMPTGSVIRTERKGERYSVTFAPAYNPFPKYIDPETGESPVTDAMRDRWYVDEWAAANGVEVDNV